MATPQLILEGLLTTVNSDGQVNLAPMGPLVDPSMITLVLRPYQSSTSFANLRRTGVGVFHVTDDVELLARAAIGKIEVLPVMTPCPAVEGWVVSSACRWYAVRVEQIDASRPRAEMICTVAAHGTQREFFGFNRAKHAVLEAAILATRVSFLPSAELSADLNRLALLVKKTGGEAEHRAFELLADYIRGYGGTSEWVDFTS